MAEAVVSDLEGDVSAVRTQLASEASELEVYLDESLTMRPFLSAPVSPYRRLVSALADLYAGQVEFFGFGYAPGSGEQDVVRTDRSALLRPESYDKVNNDYARLFTAFASEPEQARLVITDGVQSDRETGAQFAAIVEAVNSWLASGGDFAVLLYRTPYEGKYYSEAGGAGEVEYSCEDRPLVVFAFLPPGLAIDEVLSPLGESLQPSHIVELGQEGLPLRPEERLRPEGDAPQGDRVLRGVAKEMRQGYNQVYQARVITEAADSDGFVPLEFVARVPDAPPWSGLTGGTLDAVLSGLQPELRAWALDLSRDSVGVEEVDPFVRPGATRVSVEQDTSGARQVRVRVPVQRPAAGDTRRFAWVLTLRPTAQAAYKMVPSSYTTEDDTAPAACKQTLNLAPFIGTILRGTYVAGRVVLLSEWRQ